MTWGNKCYLKHKKRPNINTHKPWPISPNINPKKKGKVTVVNMAGFISLYFGIE